MSAEGFQHGKVKAGVNGFFVGATIVGAVIIGVMALVAGSMATFPGALTVNGFPVPTFEDGVVQGARMAMAFLSQNLGLATLAAGGAAGAGIIVKNHMKKEAEAQAAINAGKNTGKDAGKDNIPQHPMFEPELDIAHQHANVEHQSSPPTQWKDRVQVSGKGRERWV